MISECDHTFNDWNRILSSDRDVTLMYQGGSGGFYAYYQLLLTGEFQSGIDVEVGRAIAHQFPAGRDLGLWKTSEIWPDNHALKYMDVDKRKLFLICNPTFNPDCRDDNLRIAEGTQVVLLTTPLSIQLRMAYDKRAYWFTEVSRRHFLASEDQRQYLRWIRSRHAQGYDPELNHIRSLFKPEVELDLSCLLRVEYPLSQQKEFRDHWLGLQSLRAQLLLKQG